MTESIEIEVVCTGNGGRSPMAETLGKEAVAEMGLEGIVEISSSGSAVEDVMNLNLPMADLVQYIEVGLKSDSYKGKAAAMAQHIVDHKEEVVLAAEQGDEQAIGMIRYCNEYLLADEVAKRNMVLLEKGLVPKGHFHKQTEARPEVDLILAMKESNAKKVRQIYAGQANQPVIMPICDYAGIAGAIADPFGREIGFWRETRDIIGTAVKASIEKAVTEYGLR